MSSIEARRVTKRFRRGRPPALDAVELSVRSGEIVGLVGANGAGKSTLIACMVGHLRPAEGRIVVDGLSPDDPAAKRAIGWVPENAPLDPRRTARESLSLAHALLGLASGSRARDVGEALERVGLDPDTARRRGGDLSFGNRQRVGLARALLGAPRWLLLDEPTTGVDPAGVLMLRETIRSRVRDGAGVLLSSHLLDEVERTCDRIVYLRQGRVVDAPGRPATRTVRITFAATPGALDGELVDAIVASAGARLAGRASSSVEIEAADDDAVARTVGALVSAGVGVAGVRDVSNPLEQHFHGRSAS